MTFWITKLRKGFGDVVSAKKLPQVDVQQWQQSKQKADPDLYFYHA